MLDDQSVAGKHFLIYRGVGMKKSTVVCGALFYSALALQAPDADSGTSITVGDVTLFKKQVRALQCCAFKVRGQLLGHDLSLAEGFIGREPAPWHLLHEVVPTHVASIDLTEIAQSLETYIRDAHHIFQQAQAHQELLLLPEYSDFMVTVDRLNALQRAVILKQKGACASTMPFNPFK